MDDGDSTISWTVLTHVHREHTADWYWALGLSAAVGAALSIWLGNLLFGILIILCAGSIGFLAARGPREHEVEIDDRGISIDGTLHPYRSIKSFWVGGDAEFPRLYLTTTGLMSPRLSFPLDDINHAQAVQNYLSQRVEEVEQEPHLGEHVAEMLGL